MQSLRRLSVKHTCPRGKGQDGCIRGAFRHFPGQGCWKLTVWHSWVFRAFSRASISADFFNDSITKAHNCNPSMAEPRDQESRCASCADGSSPSHPGRALAQTASEPCGPENTDIVERQVCVAASYMALTFCFGSFSMIARRRDPNLDDTSRAVPRVLMFSLGEGREVHRDVGGRRAMELRVREGR